MLKILGGKTIADRIAERLSREVSCMQNPPALAIIQVGEVSESSTYIKYKKLFGEKIGAKVLHIELPKNVSIDELKIKIQELNLDKEINGIIVQLPLPKHLSKKDVISFIDPKKDVDGLSPFNQGLLLQDREEAIIPATPKAVMTIFSKYNINLAGKKILMIGRSLLVGKPLALLMLSNDATVTIAHSKTKNLKLLCKESDIVVVAVGKPKLLGKNCFKRGQIVIDIGTNSIKGPKIIEEVSKKTLVGDVDYGVASKVVKAITPVPGGVGPMTVACLFENLFEVKKRQEKML